VARPSDGVSAVSAFARSKAANVEVGDDHDAVLGGGALPLTLLERRVNAWIEAQQSR
jgi:uncharacterized protein (DUF885 family)